MALVPSPFAAIALLCLMTSPAWAWKDREGGPSSNVRPFLEVGYQTPVWFEGFHQGAALGFGLEIEQAPALGYLFRLELGRLWADATQPPPYFDYYYDRTHSRGVTQWSVGARGYLRSDRSLRPYGEICVGLRLADGIGNAEGVIVAPRLGITVARNGGAGLSLDSGLDFLARSPRLYGIVPVRLAIVFP